VNCQAVVQALSDYIDGLLPTGARLEVESHIAGCDRCHLIVDTTQCTILLYRAARSTALVGERRKLLLERLEKACGGCAAREAGRRG
jgi:anti-sigma factor RsiW